MKVGEQWQEGEVVEKQAARRAYEDFLHRRQDPALMEQAGGNEFTARVFPIPANGKKEIVIAYSEVIEGTSAYTLPLRGLPQLGALDVDVHAHGKNDASWALHQTNVTPGGDFVVEAQKIPRSSGLKNGDLAMMRVVPFTNSRPEPVSSAIVLVDTSASRALGLAEQARLVQRVLAKLPSDTKVVVACFDQEVAPVYDGHAAGFGEREISAIIARGALGASDFEGALAWAGTQAKSKSAKRIVVVGDGVATAGETDSQKLKAKVESLRSGGVTRLDAIAVGGIRDDGFLRGMVRGVLDRDGVVLDAKLGPEALARRLGEATTSGVPVTVAGASWSWPKTLDGLQAGDEVMVFAKIDLNVDESVPLSVKVGTQEIKPDLRTVDRPLLERAWAQAKIASLVEAPTADPTTTKQEIVALSTRYRVLSPHTALLVLETDADYRRFNIDRTANVDILTVRDGRVAVMQNGRTDWSQAKRAELDEQRAQDPAKPSVRTKTAGGKTAKQEEGEDDRNRDGKDRENKNDKGGARPDSFGDGLGNTGTGVGGGGAGQGFGHGLGRAGGGGGNADIPGAAPAAAPADEPAPPPAEEAQNERARVPRQNFGPIIDSVGEGSGADGDLEKSTTQRRARPSAPPPPPPRPPSAVTERPAATATATATAAPVPTPRPADITTRPPTTTTPATPAASAAHGWADSRRQGPSGGEATGGIRQGALVVQGGISQEEAMRVVRSSMPAMRACYTGLLRTNRTLQGELAVEVTIDRLGEVKNVTTTRSAGNPLLDACVITQLRSARFPAPGISDARFSTTFSFQPFQGVATNEPWNEPPPGQPVPGTGNNGLPSNVPQASPYDGRFKVVMDSLARGAKDEAFAEANKWRADQPGDIMALVALGEVLEAKGDVRTAARAYGSILELFSARADSRRFAGERLERLKDQAALRLAADSYGKAVEQRPDHPASHRLYAFTLLKLGEHEKAFEAIKAGAQRRYPAGRFLGVDRILNEDLGLVAAAWQHAQPNRAGEIEAKLRAAGGTPEHDASVRFVLVWETDANDVDFHIYDARGGHAYYSQKDLPSGGSLYADVTTGYGPECFTIRGAREQRAYPYTLQAHYYSRGPMGYGMGKLEIVEHDGKGNLTFEERPFVVMQDHAYVDLGTVDREKPAATASLK
jgi:TonB family protein